MREKQLIWAFFLVLFDKVLSQLTESSDQKCLSNQCLCIKSNYIPANCVGQISSQSEQTSSCSQANVIAVSCGIKQDAPTQITLDIEQELTGLPNGYIITINNQNYPVIDRIVSVGKNLTIFKLDLQTNRINRLGDEIFDNIYELVELRLGENNLASLSFLRSNMTSGLKYIDLNKNALYRLDPEWLINLSQLEVFKLNENRLSYLASETFITLSNLKILNLFRNELTVIPRHLFKNLTQLEYLNLDQNVVSKIEPLAFRDCISLRMDYEEADPTFILSISSQSVQSLEPYTFVDLKQVLNLDLRGNNINSVQNLTFYGMDKLQSIYLSGNYIEFIDGDAFHASLSKTLRILLLSDNSLPEVNKFMFANLNSLVYLYLDNNYISKIEPFSFESQASTLQYLLMYSNKIGDIREHHFSYLSALIKLNLSNNQISTIETNTFKMMKSLKELDLSMNCIFSIHSDLFVGLTSLTDLSLSDNLFHELKASTFNSQSYLVTLNLSYNSLREIPGDLFSSLKKLKSLYLNNNQLSWLNNSKSFTGLSSLTTLNLSHNLIRQLTPNSFTGIGLRTLKSLYLDNNFIDSTQSAKIPFKSLSLIDLSSNPFINSSSILPDTYSISSELILKNMSIELIANFWTSLNPSITHTITKLDISLNNLREVNIKIDEATFPRLVTLILKKSNLNVSTYLISGGASLTELDLSDNPDITYAPNFQSGSYKYGFLAKLILANTSLKDVGLLNFDKFFYLAYLDLSRNQIESIAYAQFASVFNLKFLNLSSNLIKLIEPKFVGSSYLSVVDLSNNSIQHIERELFAFYAPDITFTLYLSKNSISYFGFNSSHLAIVDLSQNELEDIPSDIKSSIIKDDSHFSLNILNLTLNKLTFIRNDSFTVRKYLEELYLASNRISYIEDYTFSHLIKLKILDLSNNTISRITSQTLVGLVRLENLDLSLNSVEYLSPDTLDPVKALNTLNLNSNKIKQIPDYLFKHLSYLKRLSLNQLEMMTISRATFEGLDSITEIESNKNWFNDANNLDGLIKSLKPKFIKKIDGLDCYRVIFIYYTEGVDYSDRYCSLMIYFARYNILFNMDIDEYMKFCRYKEIGNLEYRKVGLVV